MSVLGDYLESSIRIKQETKRIEMLAIRTYRIRVHCKIIRLFVMTSCTDPKPDESFVLCFVSMCKKIIAFHQLGGAVEPQQTRPAGRA